MPRYEYVCDECGKAVEVVVPVADRDEPRVGCGRYTCGGTLRRKVWAGVMIDTWSWR